MKYKYVIFDFNGTLYWDTHLHNEAWNSFLEKHLLSLSDQEKGEILHGKNNEEILRMLFGETVTDTQIRSFILEKEGMYQQLCKNSNLALAPGVAWTVGLTHGLPEIVVAAVLTLAIVVAWKRVETGRGEATM